MDTPAIITGYTEFYRKWIKELPDRENDARRTVRDRAIDFFNSRGFPSVKEEAWRFTNISPMIEKVFQPGTEIELDNRQKNKIRQTLFENWDGIQLVIIDGTLSKKESIPGENNDPGLVVSSFSELDQNRQTELTKHLQKSPAATDNAFTALNTAFRQDGIWIEVPDRFRNEAKVHILYYSTGRVENRASYPRLFVKVGRNSGLRITETFSGDTDKNNFTNAVGELELGEDARVWHYRIQNEAAKSFHLSHYYVTQNRRSDYQARQITSGAAISRNQVNIVLNGEYCETGLDGLYLGHDRQLIDNHTLIDHASANCHSRELFRGILTDQSRGVFSGKIMVRPDAQKTDAEQNNNALLLSDNAKIDAKPQLEIYADDVKCTHGATVGQLDEEAMFYLQSRGIGLQTARNILIYAFAEEVIEMINDKPVKNRIEKIILDRLNDDMQFVKNGEE